MSIWAGNARVKRGKTQSSGLPNARARAGEGPTFIEAKTYRIEGHFVGDPELYRDHAETQKILFSKYSTGSSDSMAAISTIFAS